MYTFSLFGKRVLPIYGVHMGPFGVLFVLGKGGEDGSGFM